MLVIADNEFQEKKMVITNPVCLAKRDNLVISVINTYDTSIKIKAGEIVAQGISCDEKLQKLIEKQEYHQYKRKIAQLLEMQEEAQEEQLNVIIESEEVQKRSKSDKKCEPDRKSGRKEYANQWDKEHFETSKEKRTKYLEDNLELEENKVISQSGRKDEILQTLLNHWGLFDITGQRIGTVSNDIKHKIILEEGKPPVRERPRPMNPIIAARVKKQFEE